MEKRTNTAKFYAPVGYARISTADQSLAPQIDALKAAGCVEIFKDYVSGVKTDRPGLNEALDHLRSGDTLIAWKLDRLGRSMSHLIDTVRDLDQRSIGFRSLTEGIDTTTSKGTLVFHLFGALAQFEHDLIRERTRAGLPCCQLGHAADPFEEKGLKGWPLPVPKDWWLDDDRSQAIRWIVRENRRLSKVCGVFEWLQTRAKPKRWVFALRCSFPRAVLRRSYST